MNEKAQVLFDYVKEHFPKESDVEIFSLMFAVDNEAYVRWSKNITGTTWVRVPGGVCPLELKDKYSRGLEC